MDSGTPLYREEQENSMACCCFWQMVLGQCGRWFGVKILVTFSPGGKKVAMTGTCMSAIPRVLDSAWTVHDWHCFRKMAAALLLAAQGLSPIHEQLHDHTASILARLNNIFCNFWEKL
ncbi:Hypothetical predicted protein, partial [Pelobates cultripes]